MIKSLPPKMPIVPNILVTTLSKGGGRRRKRAGKILSMTVTKGICHCLSLVSCFKLVFSGISLILTEYFGGFFEDPNLGHWVLFFSGLAA